MSLDAEMKRLSAIARAHEVYDCLDRIGALRRHLTTLLGNHDAAVAGNAKRDCNAFWHRLDELALRADATREVPAGHDRPFKDYKPE